MSATAEFEQDSGGTLRFSGDLLLRTLGTLPDRLDAISGPVERIDLSGIGRIDTVGAWVVHRLATRHEAAIEGLDEDGRYLLDSVVAADRPVQQRPQHGGPAR